MSNDGLDSHTAQGQGRQEDGDDGGVEEEGQRQREREREKEQHNEDQLPKGICWYSLFMQFVLSLAYACVYVFSCSCGGVVLVFFRSGFRPISKELSARGVLLSVDV